ncbi:hypothetical protein M8J76_015813 [Diaphorina citri]|nr:hypothetical protein M8J75_013494 [Diaphorina citri]KAI5737692.1 hypothetical protein M8J76_015813 [Diaphorina citri]
MMLLVQCVLLVINILVFGNTAAAEENDHTEVHGDITGTGPPGNMFDEVFKYAFKNYYNTPTSKVNSKESQRKSHRNYPRRQHYYYNQPPPPQPYPAQPYPQQFIFPQHYYMPPAAPPMPPYPAYQYPPYYPPHPPPPHYAYPYSPVKEKSAETKTTQNLWELYQQLKAKFETTADTTQPEYHRSYNRRVVQNNNYYENRLRENRRYQYQIHQQNQQYQQQQPEAEKAPAAPEEPFVRYSAVQVKPKRDNERPIQYTLAPVQTRAPPTIPVREEESKVPPTIVVTREISTPVPQTTQPIPVNKVQEKENIFEPRQEEDSQTKREKEKRWEGIMSNIKSSLGITDDSESATLPEYVKRERAHIASLYCTDSPEDEEAKRRGITLIYNSQPNSLEGGAHMGFDWDEEKKLRNKPTRDMLQVYKEYKEKYEFPDYLAEKRRIERAEYKYKKKLLYKARGMTYDDGNSDDGATLGDNTFLNLGRDPNYYPGVLRSFLKK